MDTGWVRARVQDLERRCREADVPLTHQRRVVFEALLERGDHPTADQLFVDLQEALPGLARATVYRNLEVLTEMGVISRACHPGAVVRYDARLEPHHHLVCLSCGAMVDIVDERLDHLELPSTVEHDFEVRDFRVQLRGTCSRCRERSDEAAP